MSTIQTDVGRQGKVVAVGVVVGCMVLGYVAMTWFGGDHGKASQISTVQANGRGTPTKETEHYSQVLEKYNKNEAQSAEQKGESYVSVLSNRPNPVVTGPSSAPQVELDAGAQAPASPPPSPQPTPQQDQQRAKEISDQVKGLVATWATAPHGVATVSTDASDYAKSLQPVAAMVVDGSARAAHPGIEKTKVVEDFALVPALLETDIDTDENSMVTASIPAGKYAGAQVYAMGYKRLSNTVDMTFTFMKWQGHSYKITAKAMDQDSMRTALSGDVNNRYFARIVLPAIALGIGQAGQLYQQAGSQNIITPIGSVVQTYPSVPNAAAVGGTILGGMASQAGRVLAADAASLPPKQVVIAKGTTIGVQFIGPVLSSDDLAGTSAVAQPADLNVLGQPSAQPPRQGAAAPPQGYAPGYTPSYTAPYTTPYAPPGYPAQPYGQQSGNSTYAPHY